MDPKALYKITYGLYLLTARQGEQDNGCIINTVVQVAEQPNRVAVSVLKKNLTHDMIAATGVCTVSALTEQTPFSLFQRFGMQSGRNGEKFADFSGVERGENGLYYLTDAAAYLCLKVVDQVDLGTHTLFICEVEDGRVLSDVPCCTYGYYQAKIKPQPAKARKKAWVCRVCGYVYEGETLPPDFECPLCHHGVEDFEPLETEAPAPAAPAASGTKKYVCRICGYVYEGESLPPDFKCPLCRRGAEDFILQE